jgi:ribosomal-protein-alanine N-acetyltransferase
VGGASRAGGTGAARGPKPLYLRAPDAKLPASALRLRAATQDDLGMLASLHALCFPQGWSARSIGRLLGTPGAFALVAEAGGVACGFIIVRVAADEAEILSIGVVPQARRSGTGRKLVSAGAEKALNVGATTLFLEVARENEAARALYAASGFAEAGLRPAYYREPGAKPKTRWCSGRICGCHSWEWRQTRLNSPGRAFCERKLR